MFKTKEETRKKKLRKVPGEKKQRLHFTDFGKSACKARKNLFWKERRPGWHWKYWDLNSFRFFLLQKRWTAETVKFCRVQIAAEHRKIPGSHAFYQRSKGEKQSAGNGTSGNYGETCSISGQSLYRKNRCGKCHYTGKFIPKRRTSRRSAYRISAGENGNPKAKRQERNCRETGLCPVLETNVDDCSGEQLGYGH